MLSQLSTAEIAANARGHFGMCASPLTSDAWATVTPVRDRGAAGPMAGLSAFNVAGPLGSGRTAFAPVNPAEQQRISDNYAHKTRNAVSGVAQGSLPARDPV